MALHLVAQFPKILQCIKFELKLQGHFEHFLTNIGKIKNPSI